jgi:hypothetical protein
MVNRKLITRVALTRFGVNRFTREINTLFKQGWEPVCVEIDNGWFRSTCFAMLVMPTRCDCECPCCIGTKSHDDDCECACDCCMIHSKHVQSVPNN